MVIRETAVASKPYPKPKDVNKATGKKPIQSDIPKVMKVANPSSPSSDEELNGDDHEKVLLKHSNVN